MAYEAEKRYADDWAKAKSRDLVRDVIKRTLLKFRKPKDLQVLCFPGIDATEVFQVYDALGIPRQNITGLERDSYIADQLEEKNLGIRVVRKSVEDFVEEADTLPFDIVSLDYTGPIQESQITTLQYLVEKQARTSWVLHQANLTKREKPSRLYELGYIIGGTGVENIDQAMINPTSPETPFAMMRKRAKEFAKAKEKGNTSDYKPLGYTPIIEATIWRTTPQNVIDLYRFVDGKNLEKTIEWLRETTGLGGETIEESIEEISKRPFIMKLLESYACRMLAIELKSKNVSTEAHRRLAIQALCQVIKEHKGFHIHDAERYSYISESGAPMIGDIYFAERPYKRVPREQDIANTLGFPKRLEISDPLAFDKAIRKYSQVLAWQSPKIIERVSQLANNPLERFFIGSSARPVLTKVRAIEEFQAGASVEDVARKYRGVNGKPLPQWKARVTMGTYDSKSGEEDLITEASEDRDVEKINKEQAIDLLVSGIPPKEIFEAYPTSFTQGQLRAFKAHYVIMGKTLNNGEK